jgi:hypothetical protein
MSYNRVVNNNWMSSWVPAYLPFQKRTNECNVGPGPVLHGQIWLAYPYLLMTHKSTHRLSRPRFFEYSTVR